MAPVDGEERDHVGDLLDAAEPVERRHALEAGDELGVLGVTVGVGLRRAWGTGLTVCCAGRARAQGCA
jgi:hypothetical protein